MLNNIIIPVFAASKYGLKGNDLIIYGIIYTYCKNDFDPQISLSEFATYTNSTRQGIIKNVKHLKELGMIDYTLGSNGFRNHYRLLVKE